ncbi:unnamed protein product [Rhodiola kirilowii]
MLAGGSSEQVEAASPISSRLPASINFDELGDDPDRAGGGDGVSSGKIWPRQETLALLKIKSEMDVAFRDATLKGPLWDEVSRYCMAVSILGFVYSAAQACNVAYHLGTDKQSNQHSSYV